MGLFIYIIPIPWYASDAPRVSLNEGDMRHARLLGYVKTDKNGMFELHTKKRPATQKVIYQFIYMSILVQMVINLPAKKLTAKPITLPDPLKIGVTTFF
jgi:hypothetical protein